MNQGQKNWSTRLLYMKQRKKSIRPRATYRIKVYAYIYMDAALLYKEGKFHDIWMELWEGRKGCPRETAISMNWSTTSIYIYIYGMIKMRVWTKGTREGIITDQYNHK